VGGGGRGRCGGGCGVWGGVVERGGGGGGVSKTVEGEAVKGGR